MYKSQPKNSPRSEEMEEICKIAQAHYQASSDNVQHLAREFFGTMDTDGNGKVDLREFLSFMEEEGYAQMTSNYFFEKLDLDKNGTLDFWEVMALYYIVKSGRPFCDHCKHFIPGTYFTCLGCLEGPVGGTFHLCLDCHLGQNSGHYHEGYSKFLDNYSLLEAKIRSGRNQDHDQSRSFQVKSPPSTAMVPYSSPAMAPSTSVVPHPNYTAGPIIYNNYVHNTYTHMPSAPLHCHGAMTNHPHIPERQNWKMALAALDAAIRIGTVGANISMCSIL